MKVHTIVVLSDGETWSTLDGSSICVVTDEELQALIDGDIDTRDLQPIAEIALQNLTPKTEN